MSQHPEHSSPSRRDFIAVAASALAAATVAGSAGAATRVVRFQPTKDIPKAKPRAALKEGETIRIGLIGMGGPGQGQMGTGHAQAFTSLAKAGKVTKSQLREIAEKKMVDLNANDVEAAMMMIAGSARSMGLDVVEG